MSRRAVVAAVVGWATVVGATSAVAWVAIDRAGREVLTTAADARLGPGAVATSTPRTPQPTSAVTTPPTPRATTATPSRTSASSPRSSSPRTSASRPSSRTSSSSSRTTTTPPAPSAVDRSVRVQGGQVTVRCVGRTASLRAAQPADGWWVRVEDTGPEHVKVQFSSSSQDREIEVEATCSGGTPVFSTSDDRSEESRSDD